MQGGLLATLIAAPAVIVCCGGGGVILAAITGAFGGWLSGLNGVIVLLIALAAGLTVRSIRRGRKASARPDTRNQAEKAMFHDT